MTEARLPTLSKISIEKELLNELINGRPFYGIIDKFAKRGDLTSLQEIRCNSVSSLLTNNYFTGKYY